LESKFLGGRGTEGPKVLNGHEEKSKRKLMLKKVVLLLKKVNIVNIENSCGTMLLLKKVNKVNIENSCGSLLLVAKKAD
jgi:hypothetical protein